MHRNDQNNMDTEDEIAIVGVGCRFPGANNLEDFWRVLVNAENHVNEIPKYRWNVDAIYDPNPDAYGKTYVRRAGLLNKHDEWDNVFFGVAEKEASEMDPQQKYVMECVHMALENGGITKQEIDGSATGVYIGAMNCDYKSAKEGDYSLLTNYTVTGDAASIITARVSYSYNLTGPSLVIDTACSSALVAIHLAVQSMRTGESSMAICGGVNSILYPDMFITLSKARMASPTGQCQAFSANADGYARGEGCGIVILEKVQDALKKGRHIWATIKTGCNQDGQTAKPITAPSQIQQHKLLKDVYLKHNIDPAEVQYLEAHGTGTPIGDPIEVSSLGSFFKDFPVISSAETGQRFIGSVKTNIGHLESGAGAASLIKTLLMMKNGQIVPSLHSLPRNPKIPFEEYALQVPLSVTEWPVLKDGSRAACINCFGFGGTNSHAFIKQWIKPDNQVITIRNSIDETKFIPVSAKSQNALVKTLEHLRDNVSDSGCSLKELSYTASCHRDHHRFRKMILSSNIADFTESCHVAIDQIAKSTVNPSKDYRTVFVFCGVGTAWTNMGHDVIQDFPLFRETIGSVDRFLIPLTGWSIKQKIEEGSDMDDPFTSHIAIFACQVGLATLWMHWGIKPDAIVGQSVGEVAAAYISGVLSLEDAVTVIYYRSKLLATASEGIMMVVRNFSASSVENICKEVGHVNVAVYNSAMSCTISGESESVNNVKNFLLEKNQKSDSLPILNELHVKCAYHSHLVSNCAKDIKENIGKITANKPSIPIYSTVTGEVSHQQFGSATYWEENVARPVLFYQAVKNASNNNSTIFLEIGPKAVLKAHLFDIFEDQNVFALPSMKYNSGSSQIRNTLGELYTLGLNPTWQNVVEVSNICHLPQYQFDYKRLLVESDNRFLQRQGHMEVATKYLMVTQTERQNEFKVTLSPTSTPFVYEHVIDSAITIPAATYAEIAFELGMCFLGTTAETLHVEYEVVKPTPLSKGTPSYLDLKADCIEDQTGSKNVTFSVLKNDSLVAKGSLRPKNSQYKTSISVEELLLDSGNYVERREFYNELAKIGYMYGKPVQLLESVTFAEGECTGVLDLNDDIYQQISSTSFHPAVLDAMFHSSVLSLRSAKKNNVFKIYPISVGSVEVTRPFEKRMTCFTKTIQNVNDRYITNIILTTPDGYVLAEVKEVEHQIVDGNVTVNALAYQIAWQEEETTDTITRENDKIKRPATIFYGNDKVLDMMNRFFSFDHSMRLSDVALDSTSLTKLTKSTCMETLFIVPGTHISRSSFKSSDIFNEVCVNCEAFLNIIKSLKDIVKTVFVITENTQSRLIQEDKNKNVLSAELWGLVRSLRQEGTKGRLVLIDVQPSIEKEIVALNNLVQAVLSEQIVGSSEFLVVNGHNYSNVLERRQQFGLQKNHRTFDGNCMLDLELRSSEANNIKNPFFLPTNKINDKHKDKIDLKVDLICVHSPTDYKVTEHDAEFNKYLWSDYNQNGYPVVAVEFQGKEQYSNEARGKLKTKVACYPSKVGSTIAVPPDCVCDLDDLPIYKEGLLMNAMLMWSLTDKVKRKSTVCVIREYEEYSLAVPLLLCMLKEVKQCKVNILSLTDFENISSHDGCTYIVLDKYSPGKLKGILQPGNKIIGLDNILPHLSEQGLQLKTRKIRVEVISRMNVFDHSKIVKTFPKVKKWLRHQLKNKELRMHIERAKCLQTLNLSEMNNIKFSKEKVIRLDATYVVVGGLSGLGWEIVKWLSGRGAGVVVSLSRNGPNSEMKEKLKNIADMHSSQIEVMCCDVANYADVERIFDAIQARYKDFPIKGIFQGAGVLRDMLIEHMTMDKFKEVLKPKVLGTWNLHLISTNLPLDFFIMHSSTTSVLGNAGQTNYGAANAFMDSLAHYRRAHKLPGQSLNWGALSVGMANVKAIMENLRSQGYHPLDTEKIKMCLLDSLIYNPSQMVYGMFDWRNIGGNLPIIKRLKSNADESEFTGRSTATRNAARAILNKQVFLESSFEDQRSTLATILFDSLSRVLSMDEAELEEDHNLLGLGMESQKAVEFIQAVYEATGCRLPIAYVISEEYTLGMLIDFIHSNIIEIFNREESDVPVSKEEIVGSPTWMEAQVISMRGISSQQVTPWFSIDFQLGPGLSNAEMWHAIMRWVTIKNPELRTLYTPTNENIRFGFKKLILDPEDSMIDFRIVDSSTMAKEWTTEDIKQHCSFDISTDPPLRVLYSTGTNHRIRFVMSHVTFDVNSFLTLLNEIQGNIENFLLLQTVSIEPIETIDMASIMEERLEVEYYLLEGYWTQQLSRVNDVPSFSYSGKCIPISTESIVITSSLPGELVAKLSTNDRKTTIPKLLFSLYQILLHKVSNKPIIPVVLYVDMRQHFPELIQRVSLGTNFIPVIAEFAGKEATLNDCIMMCSQEMTNAIGNSLYPFSLIKKMENYQDDHYRHFFNFRDISMPSMRSSKYPDYWMHQTRFNTGFFMEAETALDVMHDHLAGKIDLVLTYNPVILNEKTAREVLDDLCLLAYASLLDNEVLIDDITLLSCSSHLTDAFENILSSVVFMKETSNGWEHTAKLNVHERDGVPIINWKRPEKCRRTSKAIPVTSITGVKIEELEDSWRLIIQTLKRNYFFRADDYFSIRIWRDRIWKLMSESRERPALAWEAK